MLKIYNPHINNNSNHIGKEQNKINIGSLPSGTIFETEDGSICMTVSENCESMDRQWNADYRTLFLLYDKNGKTVHTIGCSDKKEIIKRVFGEMIMEDGQIKIK